MDDSEKDRTPVPDYAASQPASRDKATNSWVIPAVTAAIVLSAFCLYYFVYVSARREYLENRNFRALATLGDQLQTIVSIHGSVLEYYADQKDPDRMQPHDGDKKGLKEFLLVQPEDEHLKQKEQEDEALRDYLRFYAPPGFEFQETPGKPTKRLSRLDTVRRNGVWYMHLLASFHEGGKSEFSGSRPLAEVMKPLVGSLPFDDILVVSQRGEIVYQKEKAGAQFTKLGDLLLTAAIAPKPSGGQQPEGTGSAPRQQEGAVDTDSILRNADPIWHNNPVHLVDVALAGTRYKLFLQPVLLNAFVDDPADRQSPQEFVLCGLRSSQTLEWEALSISSTVIMWVTAAFFVISMGGPMLKVAFMNNRERLPMRQILLLGLFLVLMAAVFTFCGLQSLQIPANDDTDVQLQALGEHLSTNIVTELRNMRVQLVNWCNSGELHEDLQAAAKIETIRNVPGRGRPLVKGAIENTPQPGQFVVKPGDSPPANKRGYPYLENAFWTDDDGHQIVKWGAGPYVTPMIDVSQLTSYTGPRTTYLGDRDRPFYFGPVLPPNKLEYFAAMAMNTCDCNPSFCPRKDEPAIRGDIAGGSAFLVSQPLSLIDPVLPYGYAFALVDRSGLVLFHSDKTRDSIENFRQETDWNNELYAALFGQASGRSIPLNYKGRAYRARVFSIPASPETPRSLIVYRDLTSVRTRNLEAVTMAATLYLMILSGPILIAAIWWATNRPRFLPEWLWPNGHRMGVYVFQIGAYILLILLFCLMAFSLSVERTIIACFVVPYMALLVSAWYFWLYRSRADGGTDLGGRRFPGASAVLSALAGVVFLSAISLAWPNPRGLALILGFGVVATAPMLKKPRPHLFRRLETWFSERNWQTTSNREPAFLNYRTAFTAGAVLLLLLIGVLTPMALFRAIQHVELRLGLKQIQLHLASSLAERRRALLEQCKDRDDAACADFRDQKGAAWQFIVPNIPGTQVRIETNSRDDQRTCPEFYSRWLQTVIYLLHHDYNDVAAETRGIVADCPSGDSGAASSGWFWKEKTSGVELSWHGVRPEEEGESVDDVLVQSNVPEKSGSDVASGAAVAGAVTLLMGGLFWGLARKLFMFKLAPLKMTGARRAAESLREGRSILVLVPLKFAHWQAPGPKWQLNIPEAAAAGPRWAENLDLDAIPGGTLVELRHFEYLESDAETDNQKFILLQRLMKREATQIAAIMIAAPSSADYRRRFPALEVIDLREEPYYWLEQYNCPARDLIWKECRPLEALWPIGAQLAEDLRKDFARAGETIEPDTVASEILERADAYYRLLWDECSMDQKFVLAQLAEDGMLNPTNRRAIRQLVRRGLIAEDPQFRLMNESFRRFVRSVTTADLKSRWIAESRQSGWGKTHGVFFTTMIAVGVFLLATQNALWQSSAAYVTTALGALGTLTKLFNTFRGGGEPSSDKAS